MDTNTQQRKTRNADSPIDDKIIVWTVMRRKKKKKKKKKKQIKSTVFETVCRALVAAIAM